MKKEKKLKVNTNKSHHSFLWERGRAVFRRFKFLELVSRFIIKYKWFFFSFFIVAIVASCALIPFVQVNFDMTKYLPNDSYTAEGLKIMEKEFGLNGTAQIMLTDASLNETACLKRDMLKVDGIKSILWMDDFIDNDVCETQDYGTIMNILNSVGYGAGFYKIADDGHTYALFQITFENDDYSPVSGNALKAITKLATDRGIKATVSGQTAIMSAEQDLTVKEVYSISLIIAPIFIIILILATRSWIEPLIVIFTIGSSIFINMGTNFFLGGISYITNSISALLQFALAMDYSIFLIHSFGGEREKGLSPKEAIISAMQKSFIPILASSLTTIASFIALCFMKYKIGLDIGLVFSKGIIISLLSVFFFMPPLILIFSKIIDKTTHRSFIPKMKRTADFITRKKRFIPIFALLLIVPAFFLQSNNSFYYGDMANTERDNSAVSQNRMAIENEFGTSNLIAILVPKSNIDVEEYIVSEIWDINNTEENSIMTVQSSLSAKRQLAEASKNPLFSIVLNNSDFGVPEDMLSQMESDNYIRIVAFINTVGESEKAFRVVTKVREIVDGYDIDGVYILGPSVATLDIKNIISSDFDFINFLTIIIILVVIMIAYRSLLLPFLAVFVIEGAVFINMSIPYLQGDPLLFMGYLLISSIQLGATVDYGILLSSKYLEYRQSMPKTEATRASIMSTFGSIATSCSVLASAGLALGFRSEVDAVSSIGMMLGWGALLSGFMVLTLLPQLLRLFDGLLKKTTYKANFFVPEIASNKRLRRLTKEQQINRARKNLKEI